MKREMVSKLFAVGVLVCAATASQAAVVEDWDFVLNMRWDTSKTVFVAGNTAPGYYDVSQYSGRAWPHVEYMSRGSRVNTATELSWGSDRYGATLNNSDFLLRRSGIVIEKPYVTGNIATSFEGQTPIVTSANMFSHYNSYISPTHDLLSRAQLDLSIRLMLPGYGDTVVSISKSFEVHFLETTNYGNVGCSYSYNCDDDIFAVISGMDLTSTFTYDGIEYTLSYFETTGQVQQLSAAACRTMGFGAGSCYGFTTPENNKTDVMFNFSITTAAPVIPPAIPEPETYAMMLAGLGLIGAVARRRKLRN